jgi:enamine deaminase RidA (YjgF/YER057c/UK114 family)
MSGQYEKRLAELGITLPEVPTPAANYVPFVITGNLVFLSGQVCKAGGAVTHRGKVGRDLDLAAGRAAARLCAINLMAALKLAIGDLDRVVRLVSVRGYVASDPSFTEQPQVINGASDLAVAVFGEKGKHARAAVGCPALPGDAAVEVEGMFELD